MSKRKVIFLVGLLIIQLCLIWPIYPLFSTIEPMILGLPFSFAWVVFVLIAAFSLLLWYYLSDPKTKTRGKQ
ncbi:MAG: hypothetical protein U5J95_04820 [Balneolaceae bacterium]|nr:hypothetical protein [Balneolaceae bacterium]